MQHTRRGTYNLLHAQFSTEEEGIHSCNNVSLNVATESSLLKLAYRQLYPINVENA